MRLIYMILISQKKWNIDMQLVASEKQNIIETMKNLPEETSIEDAMERLYLLAKLEKGIKQADNGLTISHSEAKQRMGKWLK